MKNIIKKIGGLCLGLAMLSGVTIGVANKRIEEIKAENYNQSFTYANRNLVVTNYDDKSSYWLVPSSGNTSIGSFEGIFDGKVITSDIKITLDVACFGSGDGAVKDTFKFFANSTCTGSEITTTQTGNLPSSSTYTAPVYTISQSNISSLSSSLYILITKPGKQIRYRGATIEFSYTQGQTKELVSLEVSGFPTKTVYYEGETLDADGLTVTGTYSDDSEETITSGIVWTFDPDPFSLGNTTCDVMASVGSVKSNIFTVTGLTVTEAPLFVNLYYDDTSTTKNLTGGNDAALVNLDAEEWSVVGDKGGNSNYPGLNKAKQIRLYGAATNHNVLTVSSTKGDRLIKNIVITYGPSNYDALVKDDKDQTIIGAGSDTEKTYTFSTGGTSGFSVIHNYSNSTQVYITNIRIEYELLPSITEIYFQGSPSKTTYELDVDEDWDINGLDVYAKYESGPDRLITDACGFSFNPAKPNSTSITELKITASYDELSINKTIDVEVVEYVQPIEDGKSYLIANIETTSVLKEIALSGSNKIGIRYLYTAFPTISGQITAVENGDANHSFSFKLLDHTYLCWKSGNTLDSEENITDNSKWTLIKNTDGTCIVTNVADSGRILRFNSTSNQERFATYASTTTSGMKNINFIEIDNSVLAGNFTELYMHPEIEHNIDDKDTGACKGADGYYSSAKSAYSLLTPEVKNIFATDSKFTNYSLRLQKWASANGETIDLTTGNVSSSNITIFTINKNNQIVWIIIAVSLAGLTAIGGYFFYKKRKENF